MAIPMAVRAQLQRIQGTLGIFGFNPMQTVRALRGMPRYVRDYVEFSRHADASNVPMGAPFPCVDDGTDAAGSARGHYFHQDLHVARRVFARNPTKHVDVGSRIDGFVAHVACFREIEVFDIRALTETIPNVRFVQADAMSPASMPERYCDSLSSLHAVEHFGLGRYGDPIKPNGHVIAIENFARALRPGGTLYLSVPMGHTRIEFNAHRVFSVDYILGLTSTPFELERFSYVDDGGDFHDDVSVATEDARSSFGATYGCGIFELRRR